VKDRQLQREREYSIHLAYSGLGVLDTNQTVGLSVHAQEMLRFEVSPTTIWLSKGAVASDGPRFTLTLLNKNLYTSISSQSRQAVEKFNASFRHCLLDGQKADMAPVDRPQGEAVAFEC